ncbi:Hypp7309 [Branchiostoma lanceolatum]|uniref:Hypp7309 protein n=1 Tax=Branchiostoma lanceolatum TaxID=7740 RepID=A0A8J9YZD6_BRALA|nr:Hypp7309 [Branchiostoma lanceolatum]
MHTRLKRPQADQGHPRAFELTFICSVIRHLFISQADRVAMEPVEVGGVAAGPSGHGRVLGHWTLECGGGDVAVR